MIFQRFSCSSRWTQYEVRRQLSTWYFVADEGARGNVFSFHLEPTSHPLSLSNGLVATSHHRRNFGERSSTAEAVLIAFAILFPAAHSPKMFFADQNRPYFVVCFLSSRVIILRESGKTSETRRSNIDFHHFLCLRCFWTSSMASAGRCDCRRKAAEWGGTACGSGSRSRHRPRAYRSAPALFAPGIIWARPILCRAARRLSESTLNPD